MSKLLLGAARRPWAAVAVAASGVLVLAVLALLTAPGLAATFNARGIDAAGRGQWDRALAEFGWAIRLDPANAPTLVNRGLLYASQGDYESAIADCTQALHLDPQLSAAYLNRALAYRESGQNAQAIQDLRAYLALEPDVPNRAQLEQQIIKLGGP